jgi:pimeloyl-ACP methyl ester carboxylesterase
MVAHIAGPLHYERSGTSGPLMLFVHGNPYDHRLWMYQAAHFSTWFRCLAVDLPGYGRSPKGEHGLTLSDMAQACWDVIDDVARGEPAILLGNSVGASISIFMAGARPKQARAMILTGCGYMPNRDFAKMGGSGWDAHGMAARKAGIERFVSPAKRDDPQSAYLQQLFLDTDERLDPKAIRLIFRALEEPEPEAVYDALALPTLIIAGTADPTYQGALAMKKRIRGAELATIEDAGHVSNLDFPTQWDAHALAFLERHRLKS